MPIFGHPGCPFECEIPSPFSVDSHGVTYYGYSLTALDDEESVNNAGFGILYSPTHDQAVEPYTEAFLDALTRGERDPEKLPKLARAINLRPQDVRLVFAFEQPLALEDGVECFHVASELDTPNGGKLHNLCGRAFVGEARLDFKFEAATSVDDLKETWRKVLLSVQLKPAT